MSFLRKAKSELSLHVSNFRGWSTKRRIIVLESDDWGSIRMPSKETYQKCLANGYRTDLNIFSRYDSLLTEQDLTLLFDLLSGYKDKNGKQPVITANALVANPDFDKIKEDGYTNYHYELITETFKKYPEHHNCFSLWNKGMEEGVFHPQFHGREHLNVRMFMDDLQNNDADAHFAFDNRMPGLFAKNNVARGNQYVVAFNSKDKQDTEDKIDIIKDGLDQFENLFGFRSQSYIATNYVWPKEFERHLFESGVKYYQGSKNQLIPKGNYSGYGKEFHYTGQKNNLGQYYLVRNSHFEPFSNPKIDWVRKCMKEIAVAFQWNRPALVSTHRVNFCGFLDIQNRDNTLFALKDLLNQITSKWPDVEFVTSDQLGAIIEQEKS